MGSIVSAIGNIIGGNQANNQQQQGYANAAGILNQYYPGATNAINTGYGNAAANLRNVYPTATGTLAGYGNLANTSTNALSNLIGSGYGTHQFTNADLNSYLAPNYEFQLKQGQGQTQNMANATGGLIGGNALQGLNTFTQNFAQNAYQNAFKNYQDQRNAIFGNVTGGVNSASAPTTALSNLQSGYGSALAGLDVNQAQNQANLLTSQGNLLAGNNINSGNAAAKSTMAQYNTGSNALSDLFGGDSGSIGGAVKNIGSFFKLG
jgi:hypothetical protein